MISALAFLNRIKNKKRHCSIIVWDHWAVLAFKSRQDKRGDIRLLPSGPFANNADIGSNEPFPSQTAGYRDDARGCSPRPTTYGFHDWRDASPEFNQNQGF
jgi:hypothetical protein